jgi:hypothetical protein
MHHVVDWPLVKIMSTIKSATLFSVIPPAVLSTCDPLEPLTSSLTGSDSPTPWLEESDHDLMPLNHSLDSLDTGKKSMFQGSRTVSKSLLVDSHGM